MLQEYFPAAIFILAVYFAYSFSLDYFGCFLLFDSKMRGQFCLKDRQKYL